MGTAQCASTLGDLRATRKRQCRHKLHKLVIGNWNITPLMGKEHELVEEAKQYYLDVVGICWTKSHGSNTVEPDDGSKLFYSGVEPARTVATKSSTGL